MPVFGFNRRAAPTPSTHSSPVEPGNDSLPGAIVSTIGFQDQWRDLDDTTAHAASTTSPTLAASSRAPLHHEHHVRMLMWSAIHLVTASTVQLPRFIDDAMYDPSAAEPELRRLQSLRFGQPLSIPCALRVRNRPIASGSHIDGIIRLFPGQQNGTV